MAPCLLAAALLCAPSLAWSDDSPPEQEAPEQEAPEGADTPEAESPNPDDDKEETGEASQGVNDPPIHKHRPATKAKLQRPSVKAVKARTPKKRRSTAADRKAIEARIRGHVEHANQHDVEAYLADFDPLGKKFDLLREYTTRVFEEHAPSIELVKLEIRKISRSSGAVRVVQRSQWTDEFGTTREALTQITYRMRKVEGKWLISSTSRSLLKGEALDAETEPQEDIPEETDAPPSDDDEDE